MKHLLVAPMTAADARAILTWRYPEPYAFYSMASEDVAAELPYFLDPANAFHRVGDEQGTLVGFCSFGEDAQVPGGDYTLPALDIGLGMHPDLTGQGNGAAFLAAILAFANQHFAPERLRATVAVFNRRSQRMFERQGFQVVQRFMSLSVRPVEFVILLKVLVGSNRS
jgi:[ribosomal protein S18]-alanine N-acetyltransferase